MIADLKIIDDETAVATGDRYDLVRVLDAMCGLIDDYAAFAKAHGLAEPYTFSMPAPPRPDDDWVVKLLKSTAEPIALPYGAHTTRLIRKRVMEEKETLDAGGFSQRVDAPPYRFDLYPLAQHPLYANFGLCRIPEVKADWTTCEGDEWTAYDPAPFMRIFRHLPPPTEGASPRPDREMRMTVPQRQLLSVFLESQRQRGLWYETSANGFVTEPVKLVFPPDRFGLGRGPIRIALLRAGGD